jgi:hypothetical protein
VRRREHREARELLLEVPGQRIEELQHLDFVVEQADADGVLGVLGGKMSSTSPRTRKDAALEVGVVARVLHLGEALDRIALRKAVALAQVQDHAVVLGGSPIP